MMKIIFLIPLLKTRLPLIGNVLTPLAKSVLISLGLSAATSATGAAIQKNIYGTGTTILKISNEELNNIMKIVKSPENSGLLIKGVNETIQNGGLNNAKKQKGGFLFMLLQNLGASLLIF